MTFADGAAAFDLDDESAIVLTRADGSTSTIDVPFVAPLRRELEAFIAYVGGNGPTPKAPFADGVETVRTIERLRELAGVDRALAGS